MQKSVLIVIGIFFFNMVSVGQVNYTFPGMQALTSPIPVSGVNNYPKAGDTAVTANQAYINDFANGTGLLDSAFIKNIVTFRINEAIPRILSKPFSAVLSYKVFFTGKNGLIYDSVRTNLSLTIGYDTAKNSVYNTSASLVFYNGYKVKVKILSVTIPGNDTSLLKALEVDNTIVFHNYYKFNCTNSAVADLSTTGPVTGPGIPDELPVTWSSKLGVSGYDLEWTYVDSSSIKFNKYGTVNTPAFYTAVFQNNATRVNLTDTFTRYNIPLLFEKQGVLYARIRSFQNVPGGRRMESDWKTPINFGFSGHQTNLNWQSSTSFAEEGKRKSVVQYYDGSLRNRQTVTKDNTTGTTIVAETMYDNQGRQAIQVLPAPTLNNIIKYTGRFNSINNSEYDKTHFDKNIAGYTCGSGADSMSNNRGSSLYYSGSNPDKNNSFNQFIPNAYDYPFSETKYLPDNTGRILQQGGVGKMHQIGNGHETRYYYTTPDQAELDGLFGTEVGVASHYFKNLVRDANGQYSVSYVDMHGRTIATALAGNLADSIQMDYLSNKKDSVLTKVLTDSSNNIIKGLSTESSRSIVITRADNVTFTYTLPATTLVINGCNTQPVNYNCLYDLTITITDQCGNQTFGGQPYIYSQLNIPSASAISFVKPLPEGEYTVTKLLTINQASLEYYRDSVFLKKNLCKTIDSFRISYIDSFKTSHNACVIPTCATCLTTLGTYSVFRTNLIQQNGWNPALISTDMETSMSVEYNKQVADCSALCPKDTNRIDQITSDMLRDMNPNGGQYADTLHVDQWSIFYPLGVNLQYQNGMFHYRDDNGKLDTLVINGALTIPNNLNKVDFINNFKSSWANELLTMHPEYGRLQYLKTNISRASYDWDNDFNNTQTFRAAYAKGYLNPTKNASFVNKFSNITLPFVASPPIVDSFFIRNAASLTSMNARMNIYAISIGIDTNSIWGLASSVGYCNSGTNATCVATNKKFPFSDTSVCSASADMAWKSFAGLYESYKTQLVNGVVATGSTVSAQLNTAFSIGTHTSRFNFDGSSIVNKSIIGLASGDTTVAKRVTNTAAINNYLRIQYDSTCLSYAGVWWAQLATCTTDKLLPDYANIINDLRNVCRKGSDANHPNGSSSISPDSSYTFTDFDTVINYYVAKYNAVNTIKINSQSCNGDLILYPKAYAASQIITDKPLFGLPDSATCNRVTALYNTYQSATGAYTSFSNYLAIVYNTTITDSVLNLLMSRCALPANACNYLSSPIILPPALQGGYNTSCISCDRMRKIQALFTARYPGKVPNSVINPADTIQTGINLLYENFVSNQTGFSRHTPEYMAFANSCGAFLSPSIDTLNKIVSLFNNNYYNYGRTYDANGCDTNSWKVDYRQPTAEYFPFQYGVDYNARTNNTPYSHQSVFNNGFMQFPDSLNVGSVPNNVGFEFEGHDSACVNGKFSFEIRFKDFLSASALRSMALEITMNINPLLPNPVNGMNTKYQFVWDSLYNQTDLCWVNPINTYCWGNAGILNLDYSYFRNLKFTFFGDSMKCYVDGIQLTNVPFPNANPQTVYGFGFAYSAGPGVHRKPAVVDWIKLYDQNDNVFYNEDFNDCSNFSMFSPYIECPKLDCKTYFAYTYNKYTGKNLNFASVDSIYLAVTGQHPPVCGLSDSCINFKYQKTYGGTNTDQFSDLKQTLDGGYIAAGSTSSFGNGSTDASLVKTDKKGNVTWSKTYGGAAADIFTKVIQTADSGYVAIGTTNSYHQSKGEIFVVKTDASGTIQWSKGFAQGTANGEVGYDIVQTPADSGYALVGLYNNAPGLADWETIKLSKTGAVLWSKRLGTAKTEKVGGILVDGDTLVVAGTTYAASSGNPSSPNTIFTYQSPADTTLNDNNGSIELGVKFRSSISGYITGVRFYKTTGNVGTHIGELYSNTGTRLAQATFVTESANGWQQVLFNTPVAVTAGTTYIAAYYSASGNYTSTVNYFITGLTNGTLTAIADESDGNNGLYKYSATPIVPSVPYSHSNYWVDVIFSTSVPAAVSVAGASQIIVLPTTTATLNGNGSTGLITNYAWTKISGPNTPVITTPTSVSTTVTGLIQGVYVFQLSVNSGASISTLTITVQSAPVSNTIFTSQTPAGSTLNDLTGGIELGVKFRTNVGGVVTGIKFYKTTGNSGTHMGELYSSTGTRLAQATFSGETASGWQTVLFSTPIVISANTTYIASYYSASGNYTNTLNYFASALVNGSVTALADGTDGNNGLYSYTNVPAAPSSTFSKSNYWVDVIFNAYSSPIAIAGAGQIITLPASSIALNGSNSTGPITSYSWTKVSGPNTPVITTPTTVSTTVTGLISGVYVFQLSLNAGASTSNITVTVQAAPSGNRGVLFKMNRANGSLIWTKSYTLESLNNGIIGLTKTSNGYKANALDASDTITTNGSNIVLDLDRNGYSRWSKKIPVPAGSTVGYGTGFPTKDNGYVFAQGQTSADADIYLHKLDNNGTIVWSNRIKRPGNQKLLKVIQNADSSFAGAGFDSTKALLIKTDKKGKTSCYDTSYSYTSAPVLTVVDTISLTVNSSLTFSNTDIAVTGVTALPTKVVVCSTDSCPTPASLTSLTLCNNPTLQFLPQIAIAPAPTPCADSVSWAASRAANVYSYYSDSVKGSFINAYIGKCLQVAKNELFTAKDSISEYHYTLYYYDQAGNLVKTVPPAGVVRSYNPTWLSQVKTARANGTLLAPAHTLVTNYRYSTLNLVVSQNTPDAKTSNFWYDRLGRLVLSQNFKQLSEGTNYSYTLYDPIGRITEVGQINTGIGAVTTNTTKVPSQWTSWLASNASNRYQLTNTVYDLSAPGTIAPWLIQNPSTLRNRVSYSQATPGQKGSALVYATYYNYDIAGNVSTLLQDYGATSPMGLNAQQYKRVDYNYDLISGKVNSVAYQSGKPDAFMHFYQYDAENRLTDVYSSADSVTVEHEAHYVYYKHGPLARVLIGANQVQGLDYAYTLQGWLKSVNGTSLNPVNDMGQDGNTANQSQQYIGRDAYGFSLHYFEGDYSPINGSPFLSGLKAQLATNYKGLYNGNIYSMAVNIGILNNPKLYNYKYDQLNRLTVMVAFDGRNTGQNLWTGGLFPNTDYTEIVTYDPNGNIKTYYRNGYAVVNTPMDQLTYNYRTGTNKLTSVGDAAAAGNYPNDLDNQSANNYTYDSIGNLLTDQQAGITAPMTWSVYGKLLTISSKSVSYQYDASGNRIGKTAAGTNTWYVRDAQGNVLSVYSGSTMALQEQDLYGSSRLGMISGATALPNTAQFLDALGSGTLFTFTRGKKLFELSNHLGNVLETISDKKFGTSVAGVPSQASYYTADVKTAQDYYPGGMLQPGRAFVAGTSYRYGFNGQEISTEISSSGNLYNAEFWEYDSRSVRRWNLDPKPNVGISEYSAFNNNPIWFSDHLGDSSGPAMTRVWGGLKAVGGLFEMGLGGAGGVATSWTGVGAIAGGAAVVHGADVTSSGLTQLWTGRESTTFTQQGISKGLQLAGVSKNKADLAAGYTDATLSIALSAGAGALRDGTFLKQPVIGVLRTPAANIADEATTQMTTVGRWMSKAEYNIMKNSGTMVEGAGGQTFVSTGGSSAYKAATKGSVYAEFQVPSNSLVPGGQTNWFKILGPSAKPSQLYLLQKQGGQLLPQVENLSPILKVK